MTHANRTFSIWIDVTGLALPLLVIFAYVLGWSPALQIGLTIVFFAAVLGTRIALTDWGEWREGRARRRRPRR